MTRNSTTSMTQAPPSTGVASTSAAASEARLHAPMDSHSRVPFIMPISWMWIALIAGFFISLHWKLIERMFRIATNAQGDSIFTLLVNALSSKWSNDWSHILAIPFISLFYVLQNKRSLMTQPLRVFWPGLILMLMGIVLYMLGIYPVRNDLFQGGALVMGLFGLTLFLLGPHAMKILWFPIVYLILAIKVPGQIWEALAARLQHIAAGTAGQILKVLGVFLNFEADNYGNQIDLTFTDSAGRMVTSSLNVAEACAGLRMLMAFIALGVAIAFFFQRPLWQKLLICALTVPVAVAVNVGRVTVIGLIHLVDPAYAQGDFHTMVGILMLIPAALIFMLVGWIADRIFIRDEDEDESNATEADHDLDEDGPPAHPTWIAQQAESLPLEHPASLKSIGLGLGAGAVLMALAGAMVFFVFAVRKPAMLADGSLGSILAVGGLILIVAALLAGYVLARRIAFRPGVHLRRYAAAVVLGALMISTLGLSSAIAMTEVVLIKQSVPIRERFYMMPTQIGVPQSTAGLWKKHGTDDVFSADIIQELGTNEYLSRMYIREGSSVQRFDEQKKPIVVPDSAVRLHLAYYTGLQDTAPHVPDRCFIGGGAKFIDRDTSSVIDLPANAPHGVYQMHEDDSSDWRAYSVLAREEVRVPSPRFNVTRFTYAMGAARQQGFLPDSWKRQTEENTNQSTVIYFFAANGKLLAGPNDVRLLGFDPRDKYSYYCKVEVGVPTAKTPAEALRIANEFLSVAMPEILRCLPDWVDVTEGRWPPKSVPATPASE